MQVDAPMKFPGTEEERRRNIATHSIESYSQRCRWCDCRPWGRSIEWPCGTTPPRVVTTTDDR